MKILKNIIRRLPIVFAFLFFTIACSDMESIHEEYLQGEKIYAGKLDSLEIYTGFHRVKIVGLTDYIGNSEECIVEWEGNMVSFPIENIVDNYFEIIVEDLPERSYEFLIHTKDTDENLSIFQTIKGNAVGETFKESQFARRLSDFVFTDGSLAIEWADKAEAEFIIFTEVKYANNDGGMTVSMLYPDDIYTHLENWVPGGNIEVLSAITTGENGFDTLYLDPFYEKLPVLTTFLLDKSLFSLTKMPSDNPGTAYGANPDMYLFDGDGSYIGDTEGYHSGEDMMPHHLTIDLGVTAKITKYRVDLRDPNNWAGNHPKDFELWGRADTIGAVTLPPTEENFIAQGWQLLHSASIDNNIIFFIEYEIDTDQAYRFLRYRVTKSFTTSDTDPTTGAAQANEITFWGEVAK